MNSSDLPDIIRDAFQSGALCRSDRAVQNVSGCKLTLSTQGQATLSDVLARADPGPSTLDEAALLQLLAFYLLDRGHLASAVDYAVLVEDVQGFAQPAEVSLEITKLCNLHCLHCYNDSGSRDAAELDDNEKLALADYLCRWGIRRLTLTGGEPTLDSSLPGLLSMARDSRVAVKITTNGWVLPPVLLEAIAEGIVAHVNLSLDGADESTHDTFRNRQGSFSRVLRSMQILADCRPRTLQLNVSVHNRSVHQMDALARLALNYRFDAVSFKPVTSSGRRNGHRDFFLSPEDLQLFRAQRAHLGTQHKDRLHVEGNILGGAAPEAILDQISCNAAERSMLILSDGQMTPCSALNAGDWAPNVRNMPPMRAWLTHPLFMDFRSMKEGEGSFHRGCPGTRFASATAGHRVIVLRNESV